jgi:hypothetical protein
MAETVDFFVSYERNRSEHQSLRAPSAQEPGALTLGGTIGTGGTEVSSSLSVVMGWWPTPAHENVAWSPGDVGFAWCS